LNLLSISVFQELQERLKELQNLPLRGLLVVSGKPDHFVAGANLKEIAEIHTAAAAAEASRQAQTIFNQLADLPYPTMAVLHGPCLGGGLELALACTYRVATDHPKTALAAPEVQLGLLPGAGGTVRLPRLLGLPAALDLMLTGKRLNAQRAYQIGLVDAVVPSYGAESWARQWLEKFLKGYRPPTRPSPFSRFWAGGNPLSRLVIASAARRQVLSRTHQHYPAPLKIIEVATSGLTRARTKALEEEARGFGALAATPQSKALIHLFFTTTAKKDKEAVPRPVRHIGVIGAGLMGSGIAAVLIEKGFSVRVRDVNAEALGRMIKTVSDHLWRQSKRRSSKGPGLEEALKRLTVTTDPSGTSIADVMIEAVFEDLELKRKVLQQFESVASAQAIFASNTSALPIADIALTAKHPERVVGMHFFSPVQKMPLVEVVVSKTTDPQVTATVMKLAKDMGKHVIVVNDAPGFYVNRPLGAYITEAIRMLCEGVSVEAVDRAMREFGFPVGPFQVMDEVGWDVAHHVNGILAQAYGERFQAPLNLAPFIQEKRLGRKSGRGFYLYEGTGQGEKPVDASLYERLPQPRTLKTVKPAVIQQRLVNAFIQEAQRCLDEGVLRSEDDGDLGAVFGCGFPPFLGGPFWYLRHHLHRHT